MQYFFALVFLLLCINYFFFFFYGYRHRQLLISLMIIYELRSLSRLLFDSLLAYEDQKKHYLHEKRLHLQTRKVFATLVRYKKASISLETFHVFYSLFFCLLEISHLRFRIHDDKAISLCSRDIQKIAYSMDECFKALEKKGLALNDAHWQLNQAIDQMDEVYQHVLQVSSKEPIIFLFFIFSLRQAAALLLEGSIVSDAPSITEKRSVKSIAGSWLKQTITATQQCFFLYWPHMLRSGIVLIATGVLQYYFSFSEEYWMILAAFLALQTSGSTPLQQGIYFLCLFVITTVLFSGLQLSMMALWCFILISFFIIMLLPWTIRYYHWDIRGGLLRYQYLLWVLGIGIISSFYTHASIEHRVWDIGWGGSMGILAALFFFPSAFYTRFTEGLLPEIKKLSVLLNNMAGDLYHHRYEAIILLDASSAMNYPEWVFDIGFNPGLRAGYRYFLIQLERAQQLIFFIKNEDNTQMPDVLKKAFAATLLQHHELLLLMYKYFNKEPLKKSSEDHWLLDIKQLDDISQTLLPSHLEALSLEPHTLKLTLLVRYTKELREILFSLLIAIETV